MKVDGLRGDHSLRGGVVKSSARRRVVSPVSLQASEVLTLKSGNIPVLKRKEKDKKSDVTLKSLPQVRVYFLVPWGQGRYNKNRREIYKSFCLWWDVCTLSKS